METSYLHIRGNYALIRGFIVVSLWLLLGHNASAQSWNLVWREDFGVAEDTVIKDFPDPTMTVPNHHFYTWRKVQTGWDSANNCATYEYVEGDDCGEIQDGFYGIANSTWWAYNRFARCNKSAGYFTRGRDHTGNENGAMLIINSGAGVGEVIYSQDIDFRLCDSRQYRFAIYASSITSFSAQEAMLTLKITNKNTNTVVDSIETQEIPLWEYAGDNPHAEHEWSYYHIDFTANDGDKLSLQIINNSISGTGNDFVLDDISLFRNDENVQLPDLEIAEMAIATQTGGSNTCSYSSTFSLPPSVLDVWKTVYNEIYFLWQKSDDGGLSWKNMTAESGIEKMKLSMDIDGTETAIYRVIVTGGFTAATAEKQALYIAEHGAPENGCEYYSISNTLSSVKPEPNCKYKENLKTVWSEDFGVCDSFSTYSIDEAKLNYYEPKATAMTYGDYVVCSRPDTAIYKKGVNWDNSTYIEYTEKGNETRSMKNIDEAEGGAFLFVKVNKKTTTIYEKTIDGVFCNCKAYMFNFNFYKPDNWSTIPLTGTVLDKDGNVLGEASASIGGGSGGWTRATVPFELPIGYTGGVTIRISYCGTCANADDYARFIIDDLSLTLCGETSPQGKIGINKDAGTIFVQGFDCNDETKNYTIDLFGLSEWTNGDYPNAGFVWQSSTDNGKTWNTLAATTESINYDPSESENIRYRAIIGETKSVAQQVAANGKPDDDCSLFRITNIAGLQCKITGCKAPAFKFTANDTVTICNDQEKKIQLSAEQTNHVNIDEMQWYTSPAGANAWTSIPQAATASISVLPNDSTDYLFIARNDTCFSDSIFARINVNKAIILDPIKDTVLCANSGITLSANTLEGNPTLFIWNGEKKTDSEFTIMELKESTTITLRASDGTCLSERQTIKIEKEDSVDIHIFADKNEICAGEEVTIQTAAPADKRKTYTFSKTTDNDIQENLTGTNITESIEKTTTYMLSGQSDYCPGKRVETTVIANEIPAAPTGTKKVSYLRSDANNGAFKNILDQNPDAIETETGYTYTWYDSDGNALADIPTPAVPSEETTDDVTYTYYVERTSENRCTSQRTEVVVTIYSAPAPNTTNVEYCLNEESTSLTATISTPEGTSVGDYELIWYDDFTGSALTSAPIPTTDAAGETTYYVAQRNKTTMAESSRVPLKVNVYEVGIPSVDNNKTSYCKGDNAEELNATITGNGQSLVWTLNGEETTANSINTEVESTTVYQYKVHQTYTLSDGNTCVGDDASVDISITYVPVPQGSYSANYIRLDATNNGGVFAEDILQKEPTAATASDGCKLIWYDADMNELGGTPPTPLYDASWPEGTDIKLTYYVAQKDEATGCIGNTQKVTVTISDSPMPKVSTLSYCVGDEAKGTDFTADLKSCAEIQTLNAEDAASNYELVWFTAPNEYKESPNAGTSTPTVAPNTATPGELKFYVCQRNKNNQAMSTPSKITVTIYANPQITTKEIPSQCSYDGAIVSIDLNAGLDNNGNDGYTSLFYADATASTEITATVNHSGSYYVQYSYKPTADLTCRSEIKEIKVDIQDLSTPIITADETVCPSSNLTLKAQATSSQNNTISYIWSCDTPEAIITDNKDEITTNTLSETKGTTYNFTVTASMGACTGIQSSHKVTVGEAPLTGLLTVKEKGTSANTTTFSSQSGNELYTCGGDLTFSANFTKSEGDYTWSTGAAGPSATASQNEGDKTYKVEFTNKCPTFVEFTVHAIPLSLTDQPSDFEDCENTSLHRSIGVSCKESNYSVEWTTPNGTKAGQGTDALAYDITSTKKSDSGIYSYTINNRNCSVKGDFKVKVKEYLQIEEQTAPYIVARGGNETISLNITNGTPGTIEWTEKGVLVGKETSLPLQNVISDHTYDIHISDSNYCDAQTAVKVWVDAAIQMEIALPDSICHGEAATLAIDTAGTGAFRQEGVLPSMSITEEHTDKTSDLSNAIYYKDGKLIVDVSPKKDATYTVEYSYGSQTIRKSISTTVLQPVTIQTTGQQSVCSGDEVTLSVILTPSDVSIGWDSDNTISSPLNGLSITANPIYTEASNHQSAYTYTYQVRQAFCKPVAGSISVLVDEPMDKGQIDGAKSICEGTSATLAAASFEATHYRWDDGTNNATIQVTPSATTTYQVEMTRGKCTKKADYEVIVNSNPAILSIDSTGIRSRHISIEEGKGTAPFFYWIDQEAMNESADKEGLKFTKHTAYVQDAEGCSSQIDFEMYAPALILPSFFSPNGDGINDTWSGGNLSDIYPDAVIKIYDRYGKLLMESHASDSAWDGTYNNKKMPATDYWYEIDIAEIDKMYVGHFTLLRR